MNQPSTYSVLGTQLHLKYPCLVRVTFPVIYQPKTTPAPKTHGPAKHKKWTAK